MKLQFAILILNTDITILMVYINCAVKVLECKNKYDDIRKLPSNSWISLYYKTYPKNLHSSLYYLRQSDYEWFSQFNLEELEIKLRKYCTETYNRQSTIEAIKELMNLRTIELNIRLKKLAIAIDNTCYSENITELFTEAFNMRILRFYSSPNSDNTSTLMINIYKCTVSNPNTEIDILKKIFNLHPDSYGLKTTFKNNPAYDLITLIHPELVV